MRDTRLFVEELLDNISESKKLKIIEPKDKNVFYTNKREATKLITIRGILAKDEVGQGRKILLLIRTDRDYPQALGLAKTEWEFADCRLGGVDHEIYAVLLDFEDRPIFRSKPVKIRLLR